MNLNDYIISVKDFPKKGIIFKDISPIFLDASAFAQLIDELADMLRPLNATKLVAAEARGFMLGTPLAIKLGIGFVPARKKGKLPRETAADGHAPATRALRTEENATSPAVKTFSSNFCANFAFAVGSRTARRPVTAPAHMRRRPSVKR